MSMNRSQKPHPLGFTHLIAEVADTAMKAIVEPDPVAYVERRAYAERLDLIRCRRELATEDRHDPRRRSLFQRDIARAKIVRELALEILGAFRRLELLRHYSCAPASALSLPASNKPTRPSPSRQGIPRHLVAQRG